MDDAARLLGRLDRIPGVARLEVPIPFAESQLSEDTLALLGLDVWSPRSFEDYLRKAVAFDDRSALEGAMTRLVEHGEGFELRFRVRRNDGEHMLQAVAEPVTDAHGNVVRMSAIVFDITPRHEDEAQARRMAAIRFIKSLLGAVPAALVVLDAEGRIVFVNDRIPTELTPEELIGEELRVIAGDVLPSDRILAAAKRLSTAGPDEHEQWTTELEYEGECRFVQLFLTGLPAAAALLGEPAVLLAISDLTEQVRAQEVLATHAERLEAEVRERTEQVRARARQQQALAELGALALRSTFEDVSAAAFELLHEAVGATNNCVLVAQPNLHQVRLVSPAHREGLEIPSAVLTSLEGVDGVVPCPPDLAPGTGFVRTIPLQVSTDTHGTLCVHLDEAVDLGADVLPFVTSVAHILSEVLARELSTLRLRHADRLAAVGRLTAGIAHQLGTPLNAISAHAGLIARQRIEGDDVVASARAIEEQVERVSEQVRAVLDYARAGQREKARVDLRMVARRTITVLEPVAARRRVKLSLEDDDTPCWTSAPSQSLQQIITNLVDNGMDAQPNGGVVRVRLRCAHGGIELRVEDDGPGIPEDVRARIYDSFFTTKPPGQGTGLGLPVARGLVREARGSLSFTSQTGEGTTFIVNLPQAEA